MSTLRISIGKYKLNDDPLKVAEHWALKFDFRGQTLFYEVAGASKKESGKLNEIFWHTDASKYSHEKLCTTIKYYGDINSLKKIIQKWCIDWLKNHPTYDLHGDNCQKFVQDFLLSVEDGTFVPTQHQSIGEKTVRFGTFLTVIGLVAVVIGNAIKDVH